MIQRTKKSSREVANISATSAILSSKHRKRSHAFRLLGHAQKLLIEANVTSDRTGKRHRTRLCHAVRAMDTESVTIALNDNPNKSEARITGVQTCGCVWACPVCAGKVAIEKGNLVRRALMWAKDSNLIPIMITLTARHHAGMSLQGFSEKFKSAYQLFTNTRSWRNFKQVFAVQHHISNVEVTHNDNGWHYHKHVLLLVDKNVISELAATDKINSKLTSQWLDALQKRGLWGIGEYALKVTSHHDTGKEYLAKCGLETDADGNLSYEMTSQSSKDSRSIWDILRDASFGDAESAALYIEYVETMSGENFMTCSHGLKDLIEDYELESADESTGESSDMQPFVCLGIHAWYVVRKAHAYHELLDCVAKHRDYQAILEFMNMLANRLHSEGYGIPNIEDVHQWPRYYEYEAL